MMHKCGHDDCFTCPFPDCKVNGVEVDEFGSLAYKKGRPKLDPEEKKRRKREYMKKYYKAHRKEMLDKMKKRYREREVTA